MIAFRPGRDYALDRNEEVTMKAVNLVAFWFAAVLSGCAAFQVGSDMEAGRKAFLIGNHEAALGYFQSAADLDPGYVYGTAIRQNVWCYLGKSEYSVGQLAQARKSLEKALAMDKKEDIARLYLGLTLVRGGDPQQGLKEMAAGMRGIHDRIEDITQSFRFSFGQFWDVKGEIRSAIQSDLAMLSGKEPDVQKLIANSEWLGKRVEEEINLARRDEREELFRDGAGRQP
jgi:tetratricopeptide (TPR) repeat protein